MADTSCGRQIRHQVRHRLAAEVAVNCVNKCVRQGAPKARGDIDATCWIGAESSGDLLPPSPPAEQATARQNQARQASAGKRTGNCSYRKIPRHERPALVEAQIWVGYTICAGREIYALLQNSKITLLSSVPTDVDNGPLLIYRREGGRL
jgi:hypothetical protein